MGYPLKILLAAVGLLSAIALTLSTAYAQTAANLGFQVRIEPTGEKGPHYTVTNLTGKTVAACVVELSSSQDKRKSLTVWDALLQGETPVEPGATISQYLSHAIGDPLPDKVEVIAGVWADGQPFGQPEWVSIIFKGREMRASEFEQAAALLKEGLDQNWTRDQYLQALRDKPNSGPIYAIRSTLNANRQFEGKPLLLRNAMQKMLEWCTQKTEHIREAQPGRSPTNPQDSVQHLAFNFFWALRSASRTYDHSPFVHSLLRNQLIAHESQLLAVRRP